MGTVMCKKCGITRYEHVHLLNASDDRPNCRRHPETDSQICPRCHQNKNHSNCYHEWKTRILCIIWL